jgi:hypothetical protein
LFFAATHSIEPGAYYFVIICGLRYAEAYRRELDHFIGAIASGTTPLVGGGEGVKALALADAALEIISNGPRDRDLISRFRRAFPRERRPVGGNRAPACQKRLGEIWRRRGNGPFSERTVDLSASEATIAGREPSKGRFGNYSDPQPEICFGRDALCTI